MKKLFLTMMLGVAGILMVGCGSISNFEVSQSALEGTGLVGAPKWIFEYDEPNTLSSIGTAPIVEKDVSKAISIATSLARTELAAQMRVTVSGVRKSGTNDSDVTHTIKEVTLVGTKADKVWITPDGSRVYVLVVTRPQK